MTKAIEADQVGVNLTGILPLANEAPLEDPVGLAELIHDVRSVKKAERAITAFLGRRDAFAKVKARANERLGGMISDQFRAQGGLAESLKGAKFFDDELELTRGQPLPEHRLALSPRVLLSDLRQIADDIGFLIIPLEYLSKQAGHRTLGTVRTQVTNFDEAATKVRLRSYVLTPPLYYGVEEHARAEDPNLQTYDGPHGALMSLTRQSVLTFRVVFQALGNVTEQVKAVRDNLQAAERGMKDMQANMANLRRDVQRIQHDLLATRADFADTIRGLRARIHVAEARAAHAENTAAKAVEMILCMLDPLMFAIPEKTNLVDGDTAAYVGPCWGPDFPLIMAQAYVNGAFDPTQQAANLTKRVNDLWSR